MDAFPKTTLYTFLRYLKLHATSYRYQTLNNALWVVVVMNYFACLPIRTSFQHEVEQTSYYNPNSWFYFPFQYHTIPYLGIYRCIILNSCLHISLFYEFQPKSDKYSKYLLLPNVRAKRELPCRQQRFVGPARLKVIYENQFKKPQHSAYSCISLDDKRSSCML